MGIVCTFTESDFYCTISVGMNCRDGSDTFLFAEQQENQLIRLALMIWLHNISKIIDFILLPLQIIVYFTDYSSGIWDMG